MPGDDLHWSHTSTFQATPISAARARRFVLHHLVDHRLLHLADRVRLVASELATNALVNARADFSITLSADEHEVMLRVHDDNPLLPARRTARAEEAGRGLEIVSLLSTDWGVADEAGTTTVWATFTLD